MMLHGNVGILEKFARVGVVKQKSLPSGRLFGEWCDEQEDRAP
jgi:hypothetical protein